VWVRRRRRRHLVTRVGIRRRRLGRHGVSGVRIGRLGRHLVSRVRVGRGRSGLRRGHLVPGV